MCVSGDHPEQQPTGWWACLLRFVVPAFYMTSWAPWLRIIATAGRARHCGAADHARVLMSALWLHHRMAQPTAPPYARRGDEAGPRVGDGPGGLIATRQWPALATSSRSGPAIVMPRCDGRCRHRHG